MAGWVKLHRCLINKPIFDNANLLKVWVWCLSKATHSEHDQLVGLQVVKLIPGQFIFGRLKAAEELKMPPSTVWRLINFLKKNESLDIKTNNKYSLVTINNWGSYQADENKMDTKTDIKRTTDGQQMDTNKNVKNDKNDKKNSYSEFVKLTTAEYERLINEFGQAAVDRMIEILNNYKGSKGKKYASDNLAIRSWVIDRYKDEQKQTKLFDNQQPKTVADKAEEAKRRYELRHGIATSNSNERSISIV